MHVLTSVSFSHYVEKARWALTRYDVPYRDRRFLPFFHFAGVLTEHRGSAGRRDKASSRFSTPVLRTPSGELFCDSGDILHYLSDRFAPEGEDLYPNEQVLELEQRFHDRLGPHTRRMGYAVCFEAPELLHRMARSSVGPIQSGAFRVIFPLAEGGLRKTFGIDPDGIRRSEERVRSEFEFISDLLSDGRPFLVGDRFTAADLACACMGSLVIMPPEYSVDLPDPADAPPHFRELCEEMRATPAGQFITRMFRDERNRVVGSRG